LEPPLMYRLVRDRRAAYSYKPRSAIADRDIKMAPTTATRHLL